MIQKIIVVFFLIQFLSLPAHAKEFRDIQRLKKPEVEGEAAKIIQPVESAVVEQAVEEVFSKYNTPEFEALLSKGFYNKDRLTTAIDEKVSRDATMRVLGIRGIETLGQTIQADSSGVNKLVSTVSVTVRSQMEFSNSSGFQRRDGTNELILRITQDAPVQ